MGLRRFDTLLVRLFLLMWVTLVASHAAAFFTVMWWNGQIAGEAPLHIPTFPSLPPGNPFSASGHDSERPGPPLGAAGERGPERGPPPEGRRGPGPRSGSPEGPIANESPGDGRPGIDHQRSMPLSLLRLDYAVRMIVMALGAALGARWLAAPMRRISSAAASLSTGFSRGTPPPSIDEDKGTIEMRGTARAFNDMARRLQQQYDARGLQMASVSHDLRTPLARLRLRLERIQGDDIARKAIGDIHEMDEMIHDTLAVLREQQDGSGTSVVDITSLLQSMTDDFADQGMEVSFADPRPARVRARPAALKRVLGNVLSNAIRYAGKAAIVVDPGPDEVTIDVDDDGPGIAESEMARAFEPWVRLGDAADASPARSGHGLGLAIARDLVRRDGGELVLSHREGGGLRVRIRLPAA